MGETTKNTTEKALKRSWFKGIKAEFQKIIWPDKDSLIKQTVAVISVTIALGLIIMILDFAIEKLIAFLL